MTARYVKSLSLFSDFELRFYHLHLSSPFTPQSINRTVIDVTHYVMYRIRIR